MKSSIWLNLACLALVTGKETKIAFGSCNKQAYGGLWKQIGMESPDYLILLGDNVYNDVRNSFGKWRPASVEAIQQSYAELEADEGWSALSSTLGKDRIFATWDDHDYGLDNGDKTFINREGSLEAFLNFFSTDATDYAHRLKRGGVYKSHTVAIPRGEGEGEGEDFIVKVIMLDTRYFKDPKGSSPAADILGAEQWAWLEAELGLTEPSNPETPVSIDTDGRRPDLILLGSSIQALSTQKIFEETWSDFPSSRHRLLNLVTNSPCPNVMLLSGDVHMMEVSQATCRGTQTSAQGRHLVELTSSGLSQTFINYLKKREPTDAADAPPVILSKGRVLQALYDAYEASYPAKYRENKYKDFYQGVHFSTLDFVFPDSAAANVTSSSAAAAVSGVRFNVINHLGETVYSSFYPLLPQPSSRESSVLDSRFCNSTREGAVGAECRRGEDADDFTYPAGESLGYVCTPRWGVERPHEYTLHVFCMACFMYVVLVLPALVVLWLVFASGYYVWFTQEDKRRARIEAMHLLKQK